MEEVNPVEEEPYEINLDNQGCQGGPKAGRLRALANVNIALYVHVKAWIVFLALSKFIISNASNFPSQQLKHLDGYVKAICSVSLSSDLLSNICISCL